MRQRSEKIEMIRVLNGGVTRTRGNPTKHQHRELKPQFHAEIGIRDPFMIGKEHLLEWTVFLWFLMFLKLSSNIKEKLGTK